MNKETYTIENVSQHLNRLPGIKIQGMTIKIARNNQIGTKTWGKIDFLKAQGFNIVWLDDIEVNKSNKENTEINKIKRKNKHKFTIDTIGSVKKIMKDINLKNKK